MRPMLLTITKKAIGLFVLGKYGYLTPYVRYYYRDTYYCQLNQLQYFIKDYLTKKQYKEFYYEGEFTPELVFVLPFVYWHYKNGTLKSTSSSQFTNELYFFSPKHSDALTSRTPEGNYNYEMPRIIYSQDYNMAKWLQVPYKEKYKNDIYVFEKPTLIIANRYNSEWDGPPISFFSLEMLAFIIEKLRDDFTIVYNRPGAKDIIQDNSEVYELQEFEWLRNEYPEVLLMKDLQKQNKGNANNFNHLQLMVYANANHFISIHGGTAAFASYFGGTNIILSKQGPEHHFKCFEKLYPKLSGAKIHHAKTETELEGLIVQHFVATEK